MTGSDRRDDDGAAPTADGVIRAEFDWSSRAPCVAVVEVVAIAADAEPTAIEPLHGAVDPDALDALVRSNGPRSMGGKATVSFTFADHDVTVHGDGTVVVRPVE